MSKPNLYVRVRYTDNWHDEGEHYLIEWRMPSESTWRLEAACPLVSFESGELTIGKGDLVNYTILARLRDHYNRGAKITFC